MLLIIAVVIITTVIIVFLQTRQDLRLSSADNQQITSVDDECVVDHARGCVMLRNVHDGQFHVVRATHALSVKLGTRQYVISKIGMLVFDKNNGVIYSTRFSPQS